MRLLRRALKALAFAALSLLLHAGSARADTTARALLLEVFVNGTDTEQIGSFSQINGKLFSAASELRDLGIAVPASKRDGELVELSSIAGVKADLDERAQVVRLSLPINSLATHRLDARSVDTATPSNQATGAVLNYDVTTTTGGGQLNTYGIGGARLFGKFGVVQADFTAAQVHSSVRVVRLNTTYSYSDPARLRTYAVGDVISGSLPSSRSVRLGGVQVSTNFGLRPDLITYPLPIVSGGTAVPSTVDVLVNGVRQLSQPVAPGPFYVPQLPVVGGAGQVSVTVRDAAGRQTTQTSSFYATSALLNPGLTSFSLEAGRVRRGYGVESDDYGPLAASGTGRIGLTRGVTAEGHFEATGALALGTAGGTVRIGKFAVASAAAGFSRSRGASGGQAYVSIDRSTEWYRLGASALLTSRGYRDLGSLEGDPPPRRILQANAGVTLGRQGSVGLDYTDVEQRGVSGRLYGPSNIFDQTSYTRPAAHISLLSATYSRELFGRAYAYITGYNDLRSHRGAVMAGLSFRFGGRGAINTSYETATHQATFEVSRPELDPGDVGYRIYAAHGVTDRELGEVRYRGTWGDVGLGVDHYDGHTFVQGEARGGFVLMGGSLFATNTVTDGFAVVDDGGFGKVGVVVNNRPVGKTNAKGRLLVPGLLSYQNNKIALDPTDLPLDTEWDRLETSAVPSDRAGVLTRFGIRLIRQVLLTIKLSDGTPIPVGSTVMVADAPDMTTISGFDGQAFFKNLSGRHALLVTLPDGRACSLAVDLTSSGGGFPAERSVTCLVAATSPSVAATTIAAR